MLFQTTLISALMRRKRYLLLSNRLLQTKVLTSTAKAYAKRIAHTGGALSSTGFPQSYPQLFPTIPIEIR